MLQLTWTTLRLSLDFKHLCIVIIRLGVKKGKLHSEAVAKLQGELEKEGRAASSSVAMPQKAAAGATASKRSSARKGWFFSTFQLVPSLV
jgi:hypothetical protein